MTQDYPPPADPRPAAGDQAVPEELAANPDEPSAALAAGPDEAVATDGQGSFGDSQVDDAVARVRSASQLPPMEQVAEYEAAHRTLQRALAAIDEA